MKDDAAMESIRPGLWRRRIRIGHSRPRKHASESHFKCSPPRATSSRRRGNRARDRDGVIDFSESQSALFLVPVLVPRSESAGLDSGSEQLPHRVQGAPPAGDSGFGSASDLDWGLDSGSGSDSDSDSGLAPLPAPVGR